MHRWRAAAPPAVKIMMQTNRKSVQKKLTSIIIIGCIVSVATVEIKGLKNQQFWNRPSQNAVWSSISTTVLSAANPTTYTSIASQGASLFVYNEHYHLCPFHSSA